MFEGTPDGPLIDGDRECPTEGAFKVMLGRLFKSPVEVFSLKAGPEGPLTDGFLDRPTETGAFAVGDTTVGFLSLAIDLSAVFVVTEGTTSVGDCVGWRV